MTRTAPSFLTDSPAIHAPKRRSSVSHIVRAGAKNASSPEEAAERDGWSTPWPIVHALGRFMHGDDRGFDVDVAASMANKKAPRFFDEQLDGLEALQAGRVEGPRVWCNPPWSQMTAWLDAVATWHQVDPTVRSAVVLGPLSDTTVRWSIRRAETARCGWWIVGDSRLNYVHAPTGQVQRGIGFSSIAWMFGNGLAGHGILTDQMLDELVPRDERAQDGLPLFGQQASR